MHHCPPYSSAANLAPHLHSRRFSAASTDKVPTSLAGKDSPAGNALHCLPPPLHSIHCQHRPAPGGLYLLSRIHAKSPAGNIGKPSITCLSCVTPPARRPTENTPSCLPHVMHRFPHALHYLPPVLHATHRQHFHTPGLSSPPPPARKHARHASRVPSLITPSPTTPPILHFSRCMALTA